MSELRTLKAMGVAIVMDDFGTGYSSLSYLWRFPFNKIKIDQSFMLGLDRSGRDAETIVKTIIALGRELNMRVTVEGVETAKQASFLDEIKGDQAQGFFFGRPVAGTEVAAIILADFQDGRREGHAAGGGRGRSCGSSTDRSNGSVTLRQPRIRSKSDQAAHFRMTDWCHAALASLPAAFSPRSMSVRMSSICSMPTESRT